jgi:hypothetical protein
VTGLDSSAIRLVEGGTARQAATLHGLNGTGTHVVELVGWTTPDRKTGRRRPIWRVRPLRKGERLKDPADPTSGLRLDPNRKRRR